MKAYKKILPYFDKISEIYPIHSYVRLRLLRLTFTILISIASMDNAPSYTPSLAIEIGYQVVKGLKVILPYGHPIRGCTLTELSKQILANDNDEKEMSETQVIEKLTKALNVMIEALNEVKIGLVYIFQNKKSKDFYDNSRFGREGSMLSRYLKEEISQIEQEIRFRRMAIKSI